MKRAILIFGLLFLFAACKKNNTDGPSNTVGEDNDEYVKSPQMIDFYPGRTRALLTWPNNNDKVKKVKVYWNNRQDSIIKTISAGTDSIRVYINQLKEGDYTFDIYVYDENNNRSAKVLKSGYVYGMVYGAASKKIQNITYLNDHSLKIDWLNFTEKDAIGTQLFYTNAKNTIQKIVIENDNSETLLSNIALANRGTIRTRTMYKDVLDTLFTAWDTVAYVNRQAVFDSLPGWKFRCKIKAETQTVSDFGGILEFKKKMDEALKIASKRFQVQGINDVDNNEVHFYMTEISTFEGSSGQFRYVKGVDSTNMDLLIIVNDHADKDDLSWGWLGAPYLTLGHDYKGIFVPYAVDALVHELGHFRGMYDLYFAKVTAANNTISGQAFTGNKGIMNSPYGETKWTELSKVVFNRSGDQKIAIKYWSLFSDIFQIKVESDNGDPVSGAKINLYPVIRHSASANTVRENDVVMYRGTTDTDGIYDFDGHNPFAIGQDPSDDIFNFLVKVTYNGTIKYAWMPLEDALVAGSKDDPYILTVKIP